MNFSLRRFLASFALFAALLSTSACDLWEKPPEGKFSGTLEFTEHGVGPRVTGRLIWTQFEEGQEVKKGERIAILERYDQSKRDYERITQLAQAGGATRQTVEQAALTLDDQQIVSPVEGVVLTKVHEAGEVVTAGTPVAVIGDRQKIWVKIFVPEGFVNRVQMGQKADIRFDGLKPSFAGKVTYVSPKAEFTPRNVQTEEERVTQTFAVKVQLDQPAAYIRPGVSADVYLNVTEHP